MIQIVEFPRADANVPRAVSLSVDDFETRCFEATRASLVRGAFEEAIRENPSTADVVLYDEKKAGPSFSPCIYKSGAKRGNAGVQAMTAYVIDLDNVSNEWLQGVLANLVGIRHWAWTTWSSGWKNEGECWRIVVPFAQPVDVSASDSLWRAVWSRLNERLAGGTNDGATRDKARIHFYPRAPLVVGNEARGVFRNAPIQWVTGAGALFDPTPIVEEAQSSLDAQEAERARAVRTAPTADDRIRKWGSASLEGIVRKLQDAQDGQKHAMLRDLSFCAGGLVPHAVSAAEASAALSGVVRGWVAAGRKVQSVVAAERVIASGIAKGSSRPMHPEPERTAVSPLSEDEVAAMIASLEEESPPSVGETVGGLRLVSTRETTKATTTIDTDDASRNAFESFRALGGIPALWCEEIERRVQYPQHGIMLAAGLALCAAVSARRWSFDGLTSSIMICTVAESTSGKNDPHKLLVDTLRHPQGWAGALGPDEFSTTASTMARIESATHAGNGCMWTVDEYGAVLKLIANEKNTAQAGLRPALLRLATVNTGTVVFASTKAEGAGDRVCHAPGFGLYGSTTPEALHEAISSLSVRDGFVGRHVWLTARRKLPARVRDPFRGPISAPLLARITRLREDHAAWLSALTDVKPPAGPLLYRDDVVSCPDDARELRHQIHDENDERRRNMRDENEAVLIGRNIEQIKRLCISLAVCVCEQPAWPLITRELVLFAHQVLEISNAVITQSLRLHGGASSRDPWEQKVGRVRRAIARNNGRITQTELLRATGMRAADVKEVQNWMIEAGEAVRTDSERGAVLVAVSGRVG
jgi:hypothetical protein